MYVCPGNQLSCIVLLKYKLFKGRVHRRHGTRHRWRTEGCGTPGKIQTAIRIQTLSGQRLLRLTDSDCPGNPNQLPRSPKVTQLYKDIIWNHCQVHKQDRIEECSLNKEKVISITKSDHLHKGQNLQVLSLGPYGTIYAKISPGRLFSVFQRLYHRSDVDVFSCIRLDIFYHFIKTPTNIKF